MPQFKTFGLSHIALAVQNVNRSVEFYQKVFGAEVMYLKEKFAQVRTPGSNDILVFQEEKELAGKPGGIMHFGFMLKDPGEIHEVRKAVEAVGATIKEQGEFVPGEPYIFFYDPDGYEIEVAYEKE